MSGTSTRRPARRTRLDVAPLEDRCTPSWGPIPPGIITPPGNAPTVTLDGLGDGRGSAAISATEVDYYTLVAPVAGDYRFTAGAAARSSIDPILAVYDRVGWRLAYNDNRDKTTTSSDLTLRLTAGQRIYLGITNRTGTPNGAYNWAIDGPVVDDSYENNDTRAQATNLGTLSTTFFRQGLVLGDSGDWYRFTMPGFGDDNDFVAIQFDPAEGDFNLALYDANGNYLFQNTTVGSGEVRVSLRRLAPNTPIFARVNGLNGAVTPNYALVIVPGTDDPYEDNDTRAAAANLGRLTDHHFEMSNLQLIDGVDWYRFELTAIADNFHSIYAEDFFSPGQLAVSLFDASGAQIRSNFPLESPWRDPLGRLVLDGLGPGAYYAKVEDLGGAIHSNYELEFEVPVDDEYEENDTRAQAYDLGIPASGIYAVVSHATLVDTADWYQFTLPYTGLQPSRVSTSDNSEAAAPPFRVYDSTGQLVTTSVRNEFGHVVRLENWTPGQYYVEVYGAYHPDYSVNIDVPQDDQYEENDRMNAAADLGLFTPRRLKEFNNLSLYDEDWFKFRATGNFGPDSRITLHYEKGWGELLLEVIDANGNRYVPENAGANGLVELRFNVEMLEGEYWIRIRGAELTRDNGDGTSTGLGVYATNPSYDLEIYIDNP